ncbi:ATPase family protein associated with various cellular activities (AAA) [Halanaerobium saccharolyticum]|uniref:ATPase family protein associated with various cellular activities (AAA) n=1 Tax=Halanaerobium saccharolyticum TaxID=43595 RepID=A0A4R7Z5G8_9FIRM|nr:AAA family ATPase [Halanaerobium saccharolyticum]RAK12528.1 ATPase family protein associated with various cellular activities (AAA) [Halanaerobium saccharolyticum]TDW06454.1 ATPase family protein associated with various cellular activities (AAA) [Halanaerobium saccharolyticum]TDX61702.1 ATPase family protein associated with various cellular activities (AAA) [Halanaerobium saccharolyticum]
MEHTLEILKIIEGALKSDQDKVVNYTKLLSNKLEKEGENKVADKLKKALSSNNTKKHMTAQNLDSIMNVPVDQESRLSMADVIMPEEISGDIVLNKLEKEKIEEFILAYEKSDLLAASGLEFPNTLLFYGPPGCGKTKLAHYLSLKTGLPLLVARLDSLISSYLGNTAKNIRYLFEYVETTPCILFLDEFDALAKLRDDKNELGELKRVVNSLLQNIDFLNEGHILIAATNHEQLLDPAVWRRFDYTLNIKKPSFESRKELIRLFLGTDKLNKMDYELLAHIFKDLTGAQIEDICNSSLRDSIIRDNKFNVKILVKRFFSYIDFFDSETDLSDRERAKKISIYLRNIDDKIFSYSKIAKLLGYSKAYIGQLIREGSENSE